ncbi:MAG: quercetin 2,3-dioxygenase [Nitrospirales bacterium]|nr:MAG: quercetin 2,3-dioxygenase [Nitrospirales bacterium]
MKTKNLLNIEQKTGQHWVGNGFPVTTIFSYDDLGKELSPFLLLDYAGPMAFEPSNIPRGVEQHPHRGFETVTIVYQGELEHRDNAGNAGKIGPGDVQWMTAARGILHEEMHERDFTQKGGTLEMIQLWVNLPAKDKMGTPRYQEILNNEIPVVTLAENGGKVRVIAGDYQGTRGAAKTFTPINVWDIHLNQGQKIELSLPKGFTTALLGMKGTVVMNSTNTLNRKELARFERDGDRLALEATSDATVLVLNGEPINEPIVGQGPFVMNTQEEILQAMTDYRAGRF